MFVELSEQQDEKIAFEDKILMDFKDYILRQ